MLRGFAEELVERLKKINASEVVEIEKIHAQVDQFLSEKVLLITPELVKKMMEDVMRTHLGMLVVWGNIFGGLIGVASKLAGYG